MIRQEEVTDMDERNENFEEKMKDGQESMSVKPEEKPGIMQAKPEVQYAAQGNYRQSEEMVQQRRGDRIASGVVGALLGALLTLLIMVPVVFSMDGSDYQPDISQTQGQTDESEEASEGPLTVAGVIDSEKLDMIFQYLDVYYLYDIDMKAVEDGIYSGVMEGLGDDYAYYYNEEEFAELLESNEGTYYGIGVMVSQNLKTMEITISHVFRNSPAEESGLKSGDIFIEVAGENIQQTPIDDVVDMIKGEAGSTINIKVYRPSIEDYVTVDVERRQVEQDLVYWNMMEDNIGYIQLLQFTGNAAEQLGEALADLESQGMEGVILDLRANPGGLLTSVIDVAEQLLPEGNLLTIKSKYTSDRTYPVKDSGFDYPLVVLINEYSASASEVLTGAIQDYGIGTVVGVTSYGKGVVQDVIDLGDGTGVKFTTADYYTPSGRNIHGVGIEPDVYVELDLESETDNQLEKAAEVLKGLMK